VTNPILRPIGFRPWEISTLINQQVIDQHGEEAAFLWTQRDHAVGAPQYSLKDLARLDERVESHVDGLRVAASAGWGTAVNLVEEGPGEVFAASVLAFESGDAERVEKVMEVGASAPPLARGMISALGWMHQELALREARKLVTSREPEYRRAGIAGMAIHRLDLGPLLGAAVADQDPRLAARAVRAAADLGRIDMLAAIGARFSDPDETCRFWAAWAAVRLGFRPISDPLSILHKAAEEGGPFTHRAVELAVRVMPLDGAHVWRLHLYSRPKTARLAIVAAGATGDPTVMPWLIAQMENPELARVAGAAFSMITGVDLGYADLDGNQPPGWSIDDEVMAPNSDSELRWPLPAAVAKWWSKQKGRYAPGVRYLAGEPIADRSLHETLANGRQNHRAAAALELALLHPSEILFETRERARWQQKKVAHWIS